MGCSEQCRDVNGQFKGELTGVYVRRWKSISQSFILWNGRKEHIGDFFYDAAGCSLKDVKVRHGLSLSQRCGTVKVF